MQMEFGSLCGVLRESEPTCLFIHPLALHPLYLSLISGSLSWVDLETENPSLLVMQMIHLFNTWF